MEMTNITDEHKIRARNHERQDSAVGDKNNSYRWVILKVKQKNGILAYFHFVSFKFLIIKYLS